MAEREEYAFQAEINQLLSLIINTFYSNKVSRRPQNCSISWHGLHAIAYDAFSYHDLVVCALAHVQARQQLCMAWRVDADGARTSGRGCLSAEAFACLGVPLLSCCRKFSFVS
jgi:hypothetical protein